MNNQESNNNENNSGEDNSASNLPKQHRRNKNEIEREFICGWPDCGKQYGTNAALYTHTKNKHNSQEHEETKRPSTESVSGRKGRPLQSLQDSQGFPLHNNIPPDQLPKKLLAIQIWSDSRFIDMIHLIGMYGDLDNQNLFTREMEDEMTPIDEAGVTEMVNKIRETFEEKNPYACPVHVSNFLIKASHFWKQKVQEELNYVLLYAMIFGGQRVQTLQNHIIKGSRDQGTFKTFGKLIENSTKKQEFAPFIEKIYMILSGNPSTSNDAD